MGQAGGLPQPHVHQVGTRAFIAQLDGVLKPLGFVRKGVTWNRKGKSVVEVVDVQVSKSGDAITINAGVLDPDVHARLWGSDPTDHVMQPTCTVCVRIGELIDGRDRWWELNDRTAAVEAAEKVAAHVLPFLEQMCTREGMKRWLTDTQVTKKRYPPPIISLAIIKGFLGEAAEARALLDDLHKKSVGAWRPRIAEVAGQLDC